MKSRVRSPRRRRAAGTALAVAVLGALVALPAPSHAAGPVNGKIAFTSNRARTDAIWLMDGSGANQTRLTPAGVPNREPAWAPDGLHLAFTAESTTTSNESDIVRMNADGTAPQTITSASAINDQASWAPGGATIAYTTNPEGNYDIVKVSLDGAETVLTTNAADDVEPSWSPDGTKIAFASNRSGAWEIWTMTAAGGSQTRLTTGNGINRAPAWSPDGSKIAFSSLAGSTYQIQTVNADGTGRTTLSAGGADDFTPAWSPDGSKIAFVSNQAGNLDVFVMSANGSGRTQLTTDPAADTAPNWGAKPGAGLHLVLGETSVTPTGTAHVAALLIGANGNPIAGQIVSFRISGLVQTYTRRLVTGADGWARFTMTGSQTLVPGRYAVTASYGALSSADSFYVLFDL